MPWLLLSRAEEHLTSSLSGLLVAVTPLVGVGVNRLAGTDDPVDVRRLTGLVVGLAGVVALLGLELGHVDAAAVVEVLIVAAGYATGPLILSRQLAGIPGHRTAEGPCRPWAGVDVLRQRVCLDDGAVLCEYRIVAI